MSRWATLRNHLVIVVAVLAVLVLPGLASAKPGDPLMDYSVDLTTDYVLRGADLFQSVYTKTGKSPSSFNMSPAVQPSLTLYGPAGFTFGLWGSWALTNRAADTSTGFGGLSTVDEIDYTLGWGWSNKMGSFSAGLATYTNPNVSGGTASSQEVYVTYTAPVALSPTISQYVVPVDSSSEGLTGGASYTSVGISGGDKLSWAASVGDTGHLNDITASVGYPLGPVAATFHVTDRTNLPSGSQDKAMIFWLDFNYSGSVTE